MAAAPAEEALTKARIKADAVFCTPPMTQDELDKLRLQLQVLARDLMLEALAPYVEGLLWLLQSDLRSNARTALERKLAAFDELARSPTGLALPECHPPESDMRSAEFQQALEDVLRQVRRLMGW